MKFREKWKLLKTDIGICHLIIWNSRFCTNWGLSNTPFDPARLPTLIYCLLSTFRAGFFGKRACLFLWLIEGGILHLERASCGLWLIERGMLHLKRACFGIWLMERGILYLRCACFGLCSYNEEFFKRPNFAWWLTEEYCTFPQRLFRFLAYRTRNITFGARLFWFMLIERGIFLLKRTRFALWLIERGILNLKRACCVYRL